MAQSALFLFRGQHHHHETAFQPWILLDNGVFGQVGAEPVEQFPTQFLVLHFATVPRGDRAWVGPVPVTTPERTLVDCVRDHVAPDLVEQAIAQAEARGLVPAGRAAELRRSGTQGGS